MGFDKYREGDNDEEEEEYEDIQQELEDGFDETEQYEGLTLFKGHDASQKVYEKGRSSTEGLFNERLKTARSKLTPAERGVFDSILEGKSLDDIAKRYKTDKRWIRRCWKSIREKLV